MPLKHFLPALLLAGFLSSLAHAGDDCFLTSDEKLFQPYSLSDDLSLTVGGGLRYRYLDERNRLRPPLQAGRSSYEQWRFTPSIQLDYKEVASVFVQAIDAPTFGNELPQVIIDENRSDLLQYYLDLNLMEVGDGNLHFRYGRQFLKYGSQHLISPLGWANTYRNFEGYKLYYTSSDWDIDAFAVQPVNGAALNRFRPESYDTPDQSRWFSGVYATYKQAPGGVIDIYWLWLKEDEDRRLILDGNRHTLGMRYAGKQGSDDILWSWDLEGGYQFGEEDFVTGLNQDIQAGYLSAQVGPTFSSMPWTPSLTGIFWWGSGDQNPLDGTNNTNSTLFPLGHAYWGQIDNLNGQNLLDYGAHLTVKPADKLSFLAGWHWFEKASSNDAIYNIAGVPFGGVVPTDATIGNELDLIATYQVNKNLQLQLGYFWFWYGDAVTQNPNPALANRGDAEQFYFLTNWEF